MMLWKIADTKNCTVTTIAAKLNVLSCFSVASWYPYENLCIL